MDRLAIGLRSGAAILSLVIGSAVAAQSTLPPPDVAETPSSTASEPSTSGEEIVVTGSRIRRDPLSQDAPIVFVDQADIAKTGLSSINDVLQRLPSSGGGFNGKFNNSGNLGNPPDGGGVGAGAAEIDLRYLGSRRVLVLVDGIRYVNGASASGVPGSTDLNSIPESAIERVEVLQDGASSIYGADAIAGVVNIITKRQQKGVQASAQLGAYGAGDGGTQNYQLSWGNGDGPTQIVVGGNYIKTGGVLSRDRAISRFPAPYADSCDAGGCSGFLPNGRYAGAVWNFVGGDATLVAPVLTGTAPALADFRAFAGTPDRFNFAPFNYMQIPIERYGVFANLRQELSSDINLSVKGIWNRRKSSNQAAPLPFGVGQAAGITPVLDNTTIDATNPFNPFGVTLRGDDLTTPLVNEGNFDFILRRFVEGGPRRFFQTVNTIYGVATLDGKFEMGGNNWFWDINVAYGKNKAKQTMLGNINSDHLRQALGPVANCVAPCVPFNIFGGVGSITPAMFDWVTFEQHDKSENSTFDATANLSGSILELPGGPLGLAVGLEYRKLKGRFDPDPVVAAGFSSDIPAQPTKGDYDVKEAYLELNAPLLKDQPFADLLELNGAVRFSDYSRSGSTTTFKAGANWKPIPDLRFRATWAEGFRAPSIGEFFGTRSRFDQTMSDPCSNDATTERTFANDATVRANCIAAGVPVNGSYAQANPQISVIVDGNPNLKPETSKSWVVGGVYSPSFIDRLSLEVNWYNIEIKKAIQASPADIVLQECMNNNDPVTCAAVARAPNGQLTSVSVPLGNVAAIKTKGFDVNLTYKMPATSIGRFGFTWNNSFLRNWDLFLPTADGTLKISREGTEQGSPSQAFPKWKSVGIIDWDGTTVGASLTGRYVSSIKEPGANDNKMDAKFYTDVQLRFTAPSFADNFGFALGVNNLFKTGAPGCVSCDINNFDPTAYDIPGRFVYARATVKM